MKLELMTQLFEISMRINLETEMCCFVNISAHVSQFEVKVAKSKEHYNDQLTKHSTYYDRNYGDQAENDKEFCEEMQVAIRDLNSILSRTFTKKFTAYCNLIDMACSQVFTDEAPAKKWVARMQRKYRSVSPIVGYTEELV